MKQDVVSHDLHFVSNLSLYFRMYSIIHSSFDPYIKIKFCITEQYKKALISRKYYQFDTKLKRKSSKFEREQREYQQS